MAEYLKSRQQQRAATWKGLNAWQQSTGVDFSPIPIDDFDDLINYEKPRRLQYWVPLGKRRL
jgi:hypothetical protein